MERDCFHRDVRSETEQLGNDQNITIELSELSLVVKNEENLQG